MVKHVALNPPCKDCTERCIGCHAQCSKYKLFRVMQDAVNKKESQMRAVSAESPRERRAETCSKQARYSWYHIYKSANR